MSESSNKGRPVIICTSYKGVFFGYADSTTGDVIHLTRAKMAIYWGTSRGVMELADTGPTNKSKISSPADIELRGITAVFEVTPEAVTKWESA
jgi:hypothetical protein